MLSHILSSIICETFDKEVGKFQCREQSPKALEIDFSTTVDWSREDGYCHLIIRLYADDNYVTVLTKRTWNVRPKDVKRENDKSFDYMRGEGEWEVLCDHDSCWRQTVSRIIFENRDSLSTISKPGRRWYSIVEVDPKEIRQLNKDRERAMRT